MDIGFGDVITPHPSELDYPNLIDGFPDTNILAYSLETVIAEKFQTMISRAEANSRMKDFYDLYTTFMGVKTKCTKYRRVQSRDKLLIVG